eukprot:g8759.t1
MGSLEAVIGSIPSSSLIPKAKKRARMLGSLASNRQLGLCAATGSSVLCFVATRPRRWASSGRETGTPVAMKLGRCTSNSRSPWPCFGWMVRMKLTRPAVQPARLRSAWRIVSPGSWSS